jgi:hypothetical protein
MANAVYVERVTATAGNAVFVQSVKATSVAPTGNAVIVYRTVAASVPPTGNAVFVHALATTVTGGAPTANAGVDQTAAEPWSTVTLDGSGSSDPGGSVASYAWSQVSGPAVALSGTGATRTFTAPPSMDVASFTFSLAVTDNDGLVSTPDTVQITVLPATEFKRVSGAWVPVLIKRRSAGAWV